MKTCSKCGGAKALGEFYPGRAECKSCCLVRHREYYERTREHALVRQRAHRLENLEKRRAYDSSRYEAKRDVIVWQIVERQKADPARKLRQNREMQNRWQAESLANAARQGSPWEAWEDALICGSEKTIRKLAADLERSYSSVKSRRKTLIRRALEEA